MDAAELTKLQESLDKGLSTLALREAKIDAKETAIEMLESLDLPREAKVEILTRVMESVPLKDGVLDTVKFKESVDSESKRIGKLIASVSGSGRVRGMGPVGEPAADPAKVREAQLRQKEERKEFRESATSIFGELMGNQDAAKFAASKGEAA